MIDRKIIRKIEEGREQECRKLNPYSDIGRVGIAGLKEHGISVDDFNKMSAVEQNEWAHELAVDSYARMRRPNRSQERESKHITSKKYY